jgi:hypothetical protein
MSKDTDRVFALSGFLALTRKVPAGNADTFESVRRVPKGVVILPS